MPRRRSGLADLPRSKSSRRASGHIRGSSCILTPSLMWIHTGAAGPLLVSLSPRTTQQPREGSASVDAGTPVAGPWKLCPTPKGATVRGGRAELDHEARSQSEQSLLRRVRGDLSFSRSAGGIASFSGESSSGCWQCFGNHRQTSCSLRAPLPQVPAAERSGHRPPPHWRR